MFSSSSTRWEKRWRSKMVRKRSTREKTRDQRRSGSVWGSTTSTLRRSSRNLGNTQFITLLSGLSCAQMFSVLHMWNDLGNYMKHFLPVLLWSNFCDYWIYVDVVVKWLTMETLHLVNVNCTHHHLFLPFSARSLLLPLQQQLSQQQHHLSEMELDRSHMNRHIHTLQEAKQTLQGGSFSFVYCSRYPRDRKSVV